MADFSFVTSRLATGAALAGPQDVAAILDAGITHVVDARAEYDDALLFAAQPRITYLWNPAEDDGAPKPAGWYGGAVSFGLAALCLPRTRCLYHCAAGVNRGPSLLYALLRALGLPPAAAETMIRAARPQVGLAYARDADQVMAALGYT